MQSNNKESKNNYYVVPRDFLKDIFIVPFNFEDPENPKHAIYVNEQTRHDLFYDAYDKISTIEVQYLKDQDDFFKLKEIKPCGDKVTLMENFLTKKHVNQEEDNLLRCEEWTIQRNNLVEEIYKVKSYQSNTDRFFTLVFPPNLKKYFYLYKNHGGIL